MAGVERQEMPDRYRIITGIAARGSTPVNQSLD
jgi:hypothetical protein